MVLSPSLELCEERIIQFVMCPLEFGGPSDSQGRTLKAAAHSRAKYQQGSPDCHNSAMAGQGGLDKGLMEGLAVLILKGIHPKRTAWSGDVTGQRGEPPYGQSEEAMLKRCQGNFRKAVSSRDPLKCPQEEEPTTVPLLHKEGPKLEHSCVSRVRPFLSFTLPFFLLFDPGGKQSNN